VNTKLTINLRDGILTAEGSEDFVRTVYDDFKGEVAKRQLQDIEEQKQLENAPLVESANRSIPEVKLRKSKLKRSGATTENQKARAGKYKPSFDPNLNVTGLPEFFDSLRPENVSEQILTFAMFLKERLNMETCTADHIYTCYYSVRDRTKIPTAFSQAFYNTQARTHYIQVPSLQDISVTILGGNHFEAMKKREISD
jgi:hypothetical protein